MTTETNNEKNSFRSLGLRDSLVTVFSATQVLLLQSAVSNLS